MDDVRQVAKTLMAAIETASREDDLPALMCEVIARELPVDGVAISIIESAMTRGTAAASDQSSMLIEDLQFTLGEGPCYEAYGEGAPVVVADIADASAGRRWPAFTSLLLERGGVGAIYAFPLQVGAVRLGVLDLYRALPSVLTDPERTASQLAADIVVAAILRPVARDEEPGRWWSDSASFHRTEVHLATGMVKAQLGVSIEDAFARMRAYAFANDLLIEQVAQDVVRRRLRLGSE